MTLPIYYSLEDNLSILFLLYFRLYISIFPKQCKNYIKIAPFSRYFTYPVFPAPVEITTAKGFIQIRKLPLSRKLYISHNIYCLQLFCTFTTANPYSRDPLKLPPFTTLIKAFSSLFFDEFPCKKEQNPYPL